MGWICLIVGALIGGAYFLAIVDSKAEREGR